MPVRCSFSAILVMAASVHAPAIHTSDRRGVVGVHDSDFQQIQRGQQIGILD